MNKIKNYKQAKQYSKLIASAHQKLRQYRKALPAIFGKKLLEITKIPMKTKNGKTMTYKTKSGRKPRYRHVRSWKELNDLYYIAPKSKYNLVPKNHKKGYKPF